MAQNGVNDSSTYTGISEEETATTVSNFDFSANVMGMFNEVVEILVNEGNLDRETTQRLMAQSIACFVIRQEFVDMATLVARNILACEYEEDSAQENAVESALKPVEIALQAWIDTNTSESSQRQQS